MYSIQFQCYLPLRECGLCHSLQEKAQDSLSYLSTDCSKAVLAISGCCCEACHGSQSVFAYSYDPKTTLSEPVKSSRGEAIC